MSALPGTQLVCDDARKIEISKDPAIVGIDYIEVDDPEVQTTLDVYFITKVDEAAQQTVLDGIVNNFKNHPDTVRVIGGVRVKGIRVKTVTHAAGSDRLQIALDSFGDFSTYTLVIDHLLIDPIYKRCDFSFKAGCPSRFDCKPSNACPPVPDVEPLIDYAAKDFASFRQALIDMIPTLVPSWKERHDADFGMALVDLLAYSADQLSYYQDAVANEAFLSTARHRISVRRHARLIDYKMHDGASARVFVFFEMRNGVDRTLPMGTQVLTHIDSALRNRLVPASVIDDDYRDDALRAAAAVFETTADARVCTDLNGLATHSWQPGVCALMCGATSIDVESSVDVRGLLKPGDFVLLEEMVQPGNMQLRQIVRLTAVSAPRIDPLNPAPYVATLAWDTADGLKFQFHAGKNAALVRGNLALCDHGMTVIEWHPGDPATGVPGIKVDSNRAYRFALGQGPLSQRAPDDPTRPVPVALLQALGPENAVAEVSCRTVPPATGVAWRWVRDLLDSDAFATDFTAETDNDGSTQIRFGRNDFGLSPPDGCHIRTTYRIGVGAAANIGKDAISHVIGNINNDIISLRNPTPAWGGTDPEDLDRVKLVAPAASHALQMRAVTEADYGTIAERHPQVFRAVARFTWTGSWRTVVITIQPRDSAELTEALKSAVRDFVEAYTITGYDLEIRPPSYVPLELDLFLCVHEDHFRVDVEEAVIAALGSGVTQTGVKGFFHHDNWPMGKPLFLSDLYACVQSVEGIASLEIETLKRVDQSLVYDPTMSYKDAAFLKVGPTEAIRLDNDPSFPENGSLDVTSGGGK